MKPSGGGHSRQLGSLEGKQLGYLRKEELCHVEALAETSQCLSNSKVLRFFGLCPQNDVLINNKSKNGSCFKFLEGVTGGHVITTLVDTNCDNAPNKIGRDRFLILFENNGFPNFVATESELSLCEQLLNYDTSGITDEEELREINLTLLIFAGSACAAKIVDDGWKMDY